MERTMNMFRFSIFGVACLFIISFAFSSCKKEFVENTGPSVPVSGLMAFNMAPDRSAVGFDLGGSKLGNTSLLTQVLPGTIYRYILVPVK